MHERAATGLASAEPPSGCELCPRLAAFRSANQVKFPGWYNGAVPSFGDPNARLLIVGLAPGLRGANRSGRPFTGDYAGVLLYETLIGFGFARGTYEARIDDGLVLTDAMVTNAVRCVPPENKPTPSEVATCRRFLSARISTLPRLRAILALGRVAHESALRALDARNSAFPFAHGAVHTMRPGLALYDSFHCSRLNTSTGRLTRPMFEAVVRAVRDALGTDEAQPSAPSTHAGRPPLS